MTFVISILNSNSGTLKITGYFENKEFMKHLNVLISICSSLQALNKIIFYLLPYIEMRNVPLNLVWCLLQRRNVSCTYCYSVGYFFSRTATLPISPGMAWFVYLLNSLFSVKRKIWNKENLIYIFCLRIANIIYVNLFLKYKRRSSSKGNQQL